MATSNDADLEVVEQEGGGWAVVRRSDEAVLSTHERRAGAEAERFRLAGADAEDADDADSVLTDQQGAHPGNADA